LNNKILNFNSLSELCENLREENKKIILCHGCFDLLHIGHVKYLKKAKSLGDILIVTITGDKYVNKGPGRPIFSEMHRSEYIAELELVDYVAINYTETAIEVINEVKPNYYVKGNEYENSDDDLTGNIKKEKEAVEKNNGEIFFTNEETYSSSHLLNNHFNIFSPETESYLQSFRKEYSVESIIEHIENLKDLSVLVVGDTIIDEYHYTRPLGQTGKGNVLSVKYGQQERFAGGAVAVANHISGYVDNVTLFSGIGKNNKDEEYLFGKLQKNIKSKFIYFETAPTTLKKRYVDEDTDATKLFEVYYYDEDACDKELEKEACNWLEDNLDKYDVVVVPDFGNGFIVGNMMRVISEHARYLAVNTQINSGNRGYHVITKYPKADFVSLNEPELRLAAHDRHSEISLIAEQIARKLQSSCLAVTKGTLGATMMSINNNDCDIFNVPALSTKVVDRIGAGDTFLSLASICLANKIEPKISLFIASCAAALDVQIVCNREPVDPISLIKYITTILK
jgi:rfaE bifunctional protein kinase chain/domain/rfaE bifunctional protein nucleotidyltransferase chain/domain